MIVNELSNTIDLGSTLVRAEALFRRFERTVEAIDRRSHFPAPSINPPKAQEVRGAKKEQGKEVSPEARQLLSRDPPKMDKKEVQQHGGGVHG